MLLFYVWTAFNVSIIARMFLAGQTHLCTWCRSPAVVSVSVWSIRSWGPAGEPLPPGSAAPARLSSRGRRPRTGSAWAPCSRSAACSRLWNWRTPRSRNDAVTFPRAGPVVMENALHSPRKLATTPAPETAGLPEGTSPFPPQGTLTSVHMEVTAGWHGFDTAALRYSPKVPDNVP